MPVGLYYPSLSAIINLDDLPESLDFLQEGATNFLGGIFFRNLQIVNYANGDSTSCNIELIIKRSLRIPLLGSDVITLILNADYDQNTDYTIIPLSFNYTWGIKKFIRDFDLASFDFTPASVFELMTSVYRITDAALLDLTITDLIGGSDPLGTLVAFLNTGYSTNIGTLSSSYETAIDEIITAINTNANKSVKEIIFDDYVISSNTDDTFTNIDTLLYLAVQQPVIAQFRNLVYPHLQASVEVNAAIEFSRDILIPMVENGGVFEVVNDEDVKTTLLISPCIITFDSREADINIEEDAVLNLQTPYTKTKIADLPLVLSFVDATLHFSRKTGDYSAGYQTTVTLAEAVLELPSFFSQTNGGTNGPYIKGENIIIDSEDGVSGEFSIHPGTSSSALEFQVLNGITITLNHFDLTLEGGTVASSTIDGTISIPGVSTINITATILGTGIHFSFTATSGKVFTVSNSLLIPINASGTEVPSANIKFDIGTSYIDYDLTNDNFSFSVTLQHTDTTYPKARISNTPIIVTMPTSGGISLSYSSANGTALSISDLEISIKSLTRNSGKFIKGTGIVLNNNGISGTFTLTGSGSDINLSPGNYGISVKFTSATITLSNNSITAGSLTGKMLLPGAGSTELDITLAISSSGYTISISNANGANISINRNILKPVDSNGNVVSGDTVFNISSGSISYSLSTGNIGFSITISMQTPKAQIFNVFYLSFTGLTLDFTNNSRVVKIATIAASFPPEFGTSTSITGSNIVVDSVNGFSGTLGVNTDLQYTLFGVTAKIFAFSMTFVNNAISGNVTLSGEISKTSPAYQIPFTINVNNGLEITVTSSSGIQVIHNNNIEIKVYSLIIGRLIDSSNNVIWELGFGATQNANGINMEMLRPLPVIKDLFPKYFRIKGITLFKTDGTGLKYNIEAEWANGLKASGSETSGLAISIPVDIKVGDVFKAESIKILIQSDSSATTFEATVQGAGLKLGPVTGTVDGFGASLAIKKDLSNANIGPYKTELSFIGPRGIGLQIDNPVLSGGGYLFIGDHEYMGALSLSFKNKISINAIGILTTKLPGGESGYSLLIIITAEFTPIQIGMGFTLNGVGGLLGLHRTMNTDKLRAGVKDNSLDNILFPHDIIKNAQTIISNIAQIFPPKKNRFLIGPMAKLGWGTPTLLTIEIGVIVEVPSPIVLAILGVIKAILPSETNKILAIQVNFLGIIDFDKKYISFDATLFDSKILTFGLFGDMALRIYWGDKPNFLLSVGGFHPKYTPPPLNLPDMQRLTIVLADSKNLSIRVETYFAVTSNSVQFGARVAAMARAGKFNAKGALWFDILFQFKPFYFIANMGAMFAICYKDDEIMSLYIELTLKGPNPWEAQGTGRFKFLGFNVSVEFNKTFGQARVDIANPVTVWDKLKAAIENKDNWKIDEPPAINTMVSFKEIPAGGLIVDPYGSLAFNQKLVPFDLKMDKFGTVPISDYSIFEMQGVSIGTPLTSATSVDYKQTVDFFARNEFLHMTDDEKLSRAAYEQFNSGLTIGKTDQIKSDYIVHRQCLYDEIIIDDDKTKYYAVAMASADFNRHSFGNYISESTLSATAFIPPPTGIKRVKVEEEFFTLSNKDTTAAYLSAGTFNSYTEAEAYIAQNASTVPNAIIVHSSEN